MVKQDPRVDAATARWSSTKQQIAVPGGPGRTSPQLVTLYLEEGSIIHLLTISMT